MQTLENKIKDIIKGHNLLEHPFYTSWSEGTMPSEKLDLYAREYGTFIGMISNLWDSCGYADIAEEEREHKDLWNNFAKSLGTSIADTATIEEIIKLNAFMKEACDDRSMALGALLAFEFQQPTTVESKLEGLRSHYANRNADEVYFEVHLNDWDEPGILIEEIGKLSTEEQEKALAALEQGCTLLWDALTGVHEMQMAA